jgi:hypothetical protein
MAVQMIKVPKAQNIVYVWQFLSKIHMDVETRILFPTLRFRFL